MKSYWTNSDTLSFKDPIFFFYVQEACNSGQLPRLTALMNIQVLLGCRLQSWVALWREQKPFQLVPLKPGDKETDPKANVWTSWGKDPGSGLCVLEGQDLGLWAGVLIIQSAAACPSAMGNKHPGKHVLCLYPWPLLLQWSMKLLGSAWCWSVCKAIFCSHSFSCSLVKEHIWKSSLPYPCKGNIFMKTHRNLTIAEILISCHAWLKPASSFKSFCMGSTWPCTICFHRKPRLSKPRVVLNAFAEDDISSLVPFSWSSLEVAELLYSLFFLVFPKVLIWSIWICLQAAVFLQKAMVASVPGNTGIISSKEKAKSSSKKAWNMYSLKSPSGM